MCYHSALEFNKLFIPMALGINSWLMYHKKKQSHPFALFTFVGKSKMICQINTSIFGRHLHYGYTSMVSTPFTRENQGVTQWVSPILPLEILRVVANPPTVESVLQLSNEPSPVSRS